MQYSKFDNIVYPSKPEIVYELKNALCDGNIMLEPRLQEYLKKKKFNSDNNIESCISLEKEYQITKYDVKILKKFLNGKTDIYKNNTFIAKEKPLKKQRFPSHDLFNDSRIPDIEKHTASPQQVVNRGMFVPDNKTGRYYEDRPVETKLFIDSRDFDKKQFGDELDQEYKSLSSIKEYEYGSNKASNNNVSGFDLNHIRFNPRIDPKINPIAKETHDKTKSQYRIGPDSDPRNRYAVTDFNKSYKDVYDTGVYCAFNSTDMNKAYNLLDSVEHTQRYGQENVPTPSRMSDMDLELKTVVPNIATKNKKDLNTTDYRTMNYAPVVQTMNHELETEMLRGMPSYRLKNRSYGYRDVDEHNYDYIDCDFQHPDHVVLPFDMETTRQRNKSIAKNRIYREVMQ